MPKVVFPKFKSSLRLARRKAATRHDQLHGERLARAIARLEASHRDLVTEIVARLDPTPCNPAVADDPKDPDPGGPSNQNG